MVALRPYQEDAVWRTVRLFKTHRSLLGVAPARSGKTRMALAVASQILGPDERMIMASHKEELVNQPLRAIEENFPTLQPAGAVQGQRRDVHARIICGTVQSLINRMDEIGKVDLLIIDEAHHAVSATHLKVIEQARSLNPKLKMLLITATPHRTDGRGLREICEAVAFVIPMQKLIKQGYLVEPTPCPIPLYNVDLTGVRMHGGDFDAGDLGQRMDTPEANQAIVDAWLRHASDRKTLVYTATVAHAQALVDLFVHAGVKAQVVSGETKDAPAVQERLTNGDLQLVANALKWTEGVDIPPVSCIIMARALANSKSLYIQSATRGMTAYPGKADCLIMDVTPKWERELLNYRVITERVNQPLAPMFEAEEFLQSLTEPTLPEPKPPLMARRPVLRSWSSLQFEKMLDEYENGGS